MVGTITIYRVTNPGDTIGNIAATEKIELDLDVDPTLPTPKCHDYFIDGDRDVAENPIADEDLAEHQDTGLGDEIYWFLISISKRSNGVSGGINVVAQRLEDWYQQGSENDNFPAGRFGIQINDFAVKTFVPTATKGLYFKRRKWYPDPDLASPIFCDMKFSENRES